ncbi:MAG: bifunctional pyr operon transcriptional regulator/uracil phosphoribosyltransferase PyrR [Cytophagales bacterium]|nr:MAG: bifunctional pyr operon transcriptional regulator/uracil phosphoribosyltransferase PyrR [Cytophagales bacterium]
MEKRIIITHQLLQIIIERLCRQIIEKHDSFKHSVILGMQPRGVFLAERIHRKLQELLEKEIPLGYLDTTFYRDDFRRKDIQLRANETRVPFTIEGKNVILVDDVLYTGRTVRAAMDAMIAFGRPERVDLAVLIDRKYSRDLPIQANYVGKGVNCLSSEKVLVELVEQEGIAEDGIWLIKKPN